MLDEGLTRLADHIQLVGTPVPPYKELLSFNLLGSKLIKEYTVDLYCVHPLLYIRVLHGSRITPSLWDITAPYLHLATAFGALLHGSGL